MTRMLWNWTKPFQQWWMKVRCKLCVTPAATTLAYHGGTMSMLSHVSSYHPDKYCESSKGRGPSGSQLKLLDSFGHMKIRSQRAEETTSRMVEMVARDWWPIMCTVPMWVIDSVILLISWHCSYVYKHYTIIHVLDALSAVLHVPFHVDDHRNIPEVLSEDAMTAANNFISICIPMPLCVSLCLTARCTSQPCSPFGNSTSVVIRREHLLDLEHLRVLN